VRDHRLKTRVDSQESEEPVELTGHYDKGPCRLRFLATTNRNVPHLYLLCLRPTTCVCRSRRRLRCGAWDIRVVSGCPADRIPCAGRPAASHLSPGRNGRQGTGRGGLGRTANGIARRVPEGGWTLAVAETGSQKRHAAGASPTSPSKRRIKSRFSTTRAHSPRAPFTEAQRWRKPSPACKPAASFS
jgi:hypothetical protein